MIRFEDVEMQAPLQRGTSLPIVTPEGWEAFQAESIGSSTEGMVCVRVWLRKL